MTTQSQRTNPLNERRRSRLQVHKLDDRIAPSAGMLGLEFGATADHHDRVALASGQSSQGPSWGGDELSAAQPTGSETAVTRISINAGAAQRSRVTELSITFNTRVTFDGPIANAIRFEHNNGGDVGFDASANVVNGVTVVRLDKFKGFEAEGGSLRDGRYTLKVLASHVIGGGRRMERNYVFGEADGLFRFYGDMNGDRRVDITDFGHLSLAYRSAANYDAALDYNRDGRIDITDVGQFSARYFANLP